MNRWLRRLLVAAGVLVVLVVGAAVLVPLMVPADAYRSRIEAAVREATGRSFELRGAMSFAVLPRLAFQAEQAVVGNAAGAAAPHMVLVRRLDVAVALLPLLASRIEVTRLVLTEPDIALEIARDGQPNWLPARPAASDSAAAANPAAAAPSAQSPPVRSPPAQPAPARPRDPLAFVADIALGDVRIVDGRLTWRDQRNDARVEFTGVNLRLDARGLDQLLAAQGELTWNSERVTVELTLPPPRHLLAGSRAGAPGQMQLKLRAAPVDLDVSLAVNAADPRRTTGTIRLATASPQRLARWLAPLFPLDPASLAEIGAANLRVTLAAGNELALAGDLEVRNARIALALAGRIGGAAEIDMRGQATVNAQAFQLTFESGPLSQLGQARIPVALQVAGPPLTLAFNGHIDRAAGRRAPAVAGALELAVPSVRALAAWAGRPLADTLAPGMLNALSVEGRIVAQPGTLVIADARFALDALRGSGTLEAALSGPRPRVTGTLAFDRLDLTPYLEGTLDAGRGNTPVPAAAAPAASAQGQPAARPTAGVPPPADQPHGGRGWDDAPIDASALRAADLDLSLALAGLAAPRVELGRTALRVQLDDGRLDVQIGEMALYRGEARGTVRVDARDALGIESRMEASGVQALPLLRALGGMGRLEGTIAGSWILRASGRSRRALVQDLDGEVRLRVADGALVGVNLAALLRSAASLGRDAASRETQQTDFSELAASFAVRNGIATTQDLAMAGPLLRAQGSGAIDLPQRTADMRLDTRLVATLEGQGGRDARGLALPVLVSGPFESLRYRLDLGGLGRQELRELTRDPGALLRSPGDALRTVLPGPQREPQQPVPPDQPPPDQPQPRQLPTLPSRIPGLGR